MTESIFFCMFIIRRWVKSTKWVQSFKWMPSEINSLVFSFQKGFLDVVTSLAFFHWHVRSQFQSAALPSGPKVCQVFCLLNFISLVQSVLLGKNHQVLQESVSLQMVPVLLITSALTCAGSFSSECPCRFWARNRSLLEVSGVVMASFTGVQCWSWGVEI